MKIDRDTFEIILTVVMIIASLIARTKSRKARLVRPLIEAIEDAGNPEVKRAARKFATSRGVQARLHQEVQRVTADPL